MAAAPSEPAAINDDKHGQGLLLRMVHAGHPWPMKGNSEEAAISVILGITAGASLSQLERTVVFGCCARTVRHEQRRFDGGGMAALRQPASNWRVPEPTVYGTKLRSTTYAAFTTS
jgi:hypothetical protein